MPSPPLTAHCQWSSRALTLSLQDVDSLRTALDDATCAGVGQPTHVVPKPHQMNSQPDHNANAGPAALHECKGSVLLGTAETWLQHVLSARRAAEGVMNEAMAAIAADLDLSVLATDGVDAAKAAGVRDTNLISAAVHTARLFPRTGQRSIAAARTISRPLRALHTHLRTYAPTHLRTYAPTHLRTNACKTAQTPTSCPTDGDGLPELMSRRRLGPSRRKAS